MSERLEVNKKMVCVCVLGGGGFDDKGERGWGGEFEEQEMGWEVSKKNKGCVCVCFE